MFIKSLAISNKNGIVRQINFHSGMNLIVDETPEQSDAKTGNNVGKTTVLMLIDFCLGSSGKGIYTDPENRKNEYALVKDFLVQTEVLITLTLTENLEDEFSAQLLIERNFLSRKNLIRRINGEKKTEDEFEQTLTNALIPGHYGKKPTFRQIISHNIRYKDLGINNTLRTLDGFTRDDEYETLHLFMLGCDFDQGNAKQNLLSNIKVESAFKARLESLQTRSAYETALSLLDEKIIELNQKKTTFNVNPDFEEDLKKLNRIKYQINSLTSVIGRLKLRREIISEASTEIASDRSAINLQQLRAVYEQVTSKIENIQKSFEELHEFHNRMLDEKARYISKDLPALDSEISAKENDLHSLLTQEATYASKISRSDSFAGLEKLIIELNAMHQRKGEYEATIQQISLVDANLKRLNADLADIDALLFSDEFEDAIKLKLNKFNKYFSEVSQQLYGEQYALKVDATQNKAGQKIYKFTAFNVNFSSGKKQGEISCFDIAYIEFADNEGIPCYHFLLNDKKELMHDNQLIEIAKLVEQPNVNVQFIASILRDKLPSALNDPKYFVLQLSQTDKLFRIENDIEQFGDLS